MRGTEELPGSSQLSSFPEAEILRPIQEGVRRKKEGYPLPLSGGIQQGVAGVGKGRQNRENGQKRRCGCGFRVEPRVLFLHTVIAKLPAICSALRHKLSARRKGAEAAHFPFSPPIPSYEQRGALPCSPSEGEGGGTT